MNMKYYGRKVERNEFGNVVRRFNPCAAVSYSGKEEALALKRLAATGYEYDLFFDGIYDQGAAYIAVSGREEADEFMDVWREVKRRIKKENVDQ